MKKLLIIYYTGTNNTLYLVNEFIKYQKNYEITTYSVFQNFTYNINDFDLIGLFYPIYAFNAPSYFEKKLKELKIKNIPYFIIKNSGEPLSLNNSSSNYIIRLMKRNHCQLLNEYHLLMPYYILFRHQDNMVKQMLLYNSFYIKYINTDNNLYMKNEIKIKRTFLSLLANLFGKLQRLGDNVNPHLYKVDNNCIKCYKCINECPAKSISLINNKLTFSSNCLMCMKCSSSCPTNSIHIGFLDKYKVNSTYNFKAILENDNLDGNYLKNSSKMFYRVYNKYYKEIDLKIKKNVQ